MATALKKSIRPLVSVIVPVYKVEAYLDQCVASILQQTYSNFELILVNDGSPDNSPAMCDAYAEQDNRVKVIHKDNEGAAIAVYEGIKNAQGEYVFFVDSDDWIELDMLEKMHTIAVSEEVDLVVASFIIENKNSSQQRESFISRAGRYDKKEIDQEIIPHLFYSLGFGASAINNSRGAKLFKRDILLKNIHHYNVKLTHGEDGVLSKSYILSCQSIFVMKNSYFYHYRMNNGSMMHTFHDDLFERYVTLCLAYSKIISEHYAHKVLLTEQKNMMLLEYAYAAIASLRQVIDMRPKEYSYNKIREIVYHPALINSKIDTKRSKRIFFQMKLIQYKQIYLLYLFNLFMKKIQFLRNKNKKVY